MKFRNRALRSMKHHFKMMVTIAGLLLLIILGYALYLFWFVDKAVQLSFLGAIIGIPTSILITAMSSNYEFNKERKSQEIHVIGDSLYKIISSLREMQRESKSLARLYSSSTPRDLLVNQKIVTLDSLTDSSDLETLNTSFDRLKEQVFARMESSAEAKRKLTRVQNRVDRLTDEIDRLKPYHSVKITATTVKSIHQRCSKVSDQARELLLMFRKIMAYLYR